MTHHEIVKKLIGDIRPVGETNEDNRRFANLDQMLNLIESLLMDIDDLRFNFKDDHQNSIKRAVNYVNQFMKERAADIIKD